MIPVSKSAAADYIDGMLGSAELHARTWRRYGLE